MTLDGSTPINKLLRAYPKAKDVFKKHNMDCVGCKGAEAESLEMGSEAHGVDVNEILIDLKKVATQAS